MMQHIQSLLVDVIDILPDGVECFIQAPDLDDEVILGLMTKKESDPYSYIKLEKGVKEIFVSRVKDFHVEICFQRIEIKLNGIQLFEGYDGVEFGLISKHIKMPQSFIDKCINGDMCTVAGEW